MAQLLGFIFAIALFVGVALIIIQIVKNVWMKVSPAHKEMREYEKKMREMGRR